jgi:hypothetical protein
MFMATPFRSLYTAAVPEEPTLEELKKELYYTIYRRDELADCGRYYMYQPEIAEVHWELTAMIEELHRKIEQLTKQ